jgi:superfamily II RNA helicase
MMGKREAEPLEGESSNEIEVKRSKGEGVSDRSYIPAKEYKFKLDTFQQQAVDHIERGDSVLVAAHTSAGLKYLILYTVL